MAAKTVLQDTKAPLLFLRSSFLAAAVPKTTSTNPPLIHSIQPSNQKPLPHLSGLRQYLYQQPPSSMVGGLRLGGALDSTLGKLQARGSDDEEEGEDSSVELSDDEDYGEFDSDDVCDGEYTDSEDWDFFSLYGDCEKNPIIKYIDVPNCCLLNS